MAAPYGLNPSWPRDNEFHNFNRRVNGHHNIAFSFSQIFMRVEKKKKKPCNQLDLAEKGWCEIQLLINGYKYFMIHFACTWCLWCRYPHDIPILFKIKQLHGKYTYTSLFMVGVHLFMYNSLRLQILRLMYIVHIV